MSNEPRKVKIFDTTLRDGEQSPGCSMNLAEKLKVALQLERLGVDAIEAGFAISSPGDFEAISRIAAEVKGCAVASLARLVRADIDAAAGSIRAAAHPIIHVFIATSPLHMKYKLKQEPEAVLAQIEQMVAYARAHCAEVEFSAEDASRSDRDFLCRAFGLAIAAGASTVNIPDTVGYAAPGEMADLVRYVKAHTPGIEKAAVSVHCHNDLGLGVANSLSAAEAGADQIECTLCGIGERAGNAALEQIVMGLATRRAHYGIETGIDTTQLYRSCSRLSRIIGRAIPDNAPVIGANAFAHEAGIHQHGVLADRRTYEIMTPESIGINKNTFVLGKHSGRHAFLERLASLGYHMSDEAVTDELFDQFKALSDKKKDISDYDIEALVESHTKTPKHYRLERFVINSGNTIRATAIVRLNVDGEAREDVAIGDGPIFACYKAIDKMTDLSLSLEDYSIRSVTEGEDALGQVSVKVAHNGRTVTGLGLSADILESSIFAYLHAINKIVSLEE